ncbi:MAG: anaerobic sulfatase maturase [Dehalococcoidia bacterium]|jgi:uncharacterized protein|nr:anaerobic sulfatase maturase [Dehalococcoidia bacterium]
MKHPLSVLVKPTSSRCNLNCGYCFYLRKAELYPWGDHPKLTLDTYEAFLRQYADGFPPLYNFAWQGGEPTIMGLDFYRSAVELQGRVASENKLHPRLAMSNAIQTNATMIDDDWARFLSESNFLVGVSLDGPPELHDVHRVDWKGRPTHSRVMDGVEYLRARDVPFNVLVVVNSANVDHPREVLNWAHEQGLDNLQFIPCAEPVPADSSVAETGEISPGSITPQQYGAFLRGLFDAWVDIGIRKVRIRWFDNLIQMLWGQPAEMCEMATSCGYVVLEHNGDCYPCDFFVETDWLLGNVHDTTLSEMIDSDKFREFSGQKSKLNARCQSCSWKTLCYGECPRYRITAAGSSDGTLPYFCPSFTEFFDRRFTKLERLAVNAGRQLGFPVPGGRLTASKRTATQLVQGRR